MRNDPTGLTITKRPSSLDQTQPVLSLPRCDKQGHEGTGSRQHLLVSSSFNGTLLYISKDMR